ncbi:potassium-transporting ATPase subunit C [Alteromonas gracilis]
MLRDLLRQSVAALRLMLVLTVLLGIGYPVAVWAVAQPFGDRAAGQPVRVDGSVVGSRVLAQPFDGEEWFRPRPSAVDYDTLATAPSNLGPSNPDLIALIEERRAEVARTEGVDPAEVPADAITASASGLDPHISPAYAALQTPRVAEARGLSVERVEELVAEATDGRLLGFHGEPGVNVVELNAALAAESD